MTCAPDDVIDDMLRHKKFKTRKTLIATYADLLVKTAMYQRMATFAVSEVLHVVVDSPEAKNFVKTRRGYSSECLPNPDLSSVQNFLNEKEKEEVARERALEDSDEA